jgi:hypothetical protein
MTMYKIAYILFCAIVFIACHKEEPSDCEDKICTENFVSVHINFTDKDGKGIPVKNYSAVNQRTGQEIRATGAAYLTLIAGTFIVVTDSDIEKLSAEGDEIKITGTYEATGQTKSAILKVSGGKCACHVEKLSGPDKIAFD